jgi:16S rRNA (cytidine1402-2'-O)-methyltransferase
VEEVRTARRYLSKAGLKGKIDGLQFFELNEHTEAATVESYLKLFNDGNDVALISEAGLPAVADPGAQLVALAHRHGIEVIPAVGPSSLMMSLISHFRRKISILSQRTLFPANSGGSAATERSARIRIR